MLPGIHCSARIGNSDEEAATSQGIVVGLALTFDHPPEAIRTDRLHDTVDYARLTEIVVAVSASRRFRLLESLANEVREVVAADLPPGVQLWVEVAKERSPIPVLQPSARFGIGTLPLGAALAPGQASPPRPRVRLPLRRALETDRPSLRALVAVSAYGLGSSFYSARQIAATLEAEIWGVDTDLIRDGTCYVAEDGGEIVATGSWSRRVTTFGGDKGPNRCDRFLDPATEPARIRAFFVDPRYSRCGLATAILDRCQREVKAAGFRTAELVATLTGEGFYRARGYTAVERVQAALLDGSHVELLRMARALV